MPRHSNLREVQEAAYAPRKKPSPAPLVLALLLPLLLIPAIVPVLELVTHTHEPASIDLDLASAESPPADIVISLFPGGLVSTNTHPDPVPTQRLSTIISTLGIDRPTIQLIVAPHAQTSELIDVLEIIHSRTVGEVTFLDQPPAQNPPSSSPRPSSHQ